MITRSGLGGLIKSMAVMDYQEYVQYEASFNIWVESLYTVFLKRNTIYLVDLINGVENQTNLMFADENEILEDTLAFNLKVMTVMLLLWSAKSQIDGLEEDYKISRAKYHSSVLEYYEKYADDKGMDIPLEFEEKTTFLQVDILNNTIPFFLKRIIGAWVDGINILLARQNRGAKEEVVKNNINAVFVQEYRNQTGMFKNINFHSDLSCTNSAINEDQIKKQFYNDFNDLDFFNLKENYKKLLEKDRKDAKAEDRKVFGGIYVMINSVQEFIIEDFKNEMSKVGVGVVRIEMNIWKEKAFSEAYGIPLLHKLNLKDFKND